MNREFRIILQQRKSTMLCNLSMARNYFVSILCHREIVYRLHEVRLYEKIFVYNRELILIKRKELTKA